MRAFYCAPTRAHYVRRARRTTLRYAHAPHTCSAPLPGGQADTYLPLPYTRRTGGRCHGRCSLRYRLARISATAVPRALPRRCAARGCSSITDARVPYAPFRRPLLPTQLPRFLPAYAAAPSQPSARPSPTSACDVGRAGRPSWELHQTRRFFHSRDTPPNAYARGSTSGLRAIPRHLLRRTACLQPPPPPLCASSWRH